MRAKLFIILGLAKLSVLLAFCTPSELPKDEPNLILTARGADQIRKEMGKYPLFDKSFATLVKETDMDMALGINVPIPKDPAGGYTHNRHKQNYITMYGAGIIWQLTGEKKYAEFVSDMLLEYAELYPTLGHHPVEKSYARGRLFWQQLNDAVWLVYTSQAYDCIKGQLTAENRQLIEDNLLVAHADFLSLESTRVFNRVHNHGVWAASAVGMAGYAMDKDELVQRALYGVKLDSIENAKPMGFYAQLDLLFSPDGYYTEGPYYQRYALLPYMLFAQAIDNNNPEYEIFEYRDQILRKAVEATLQLTHSDGRLFPFNDALKEMTYKAPELITAVDIVYSVFPESKGLLGVALEQDKVVINQAGLKVAKDIAQGKAEPFKRLSLELRDGVEGNSGAVGVLRSNTGKKATSAIMKYASQGMGHGHFDRLAIMMHDNENEILSDYGAARYVNVEYKHGGRYLPENNTWAKQTVAHNTVVIDKTTQFNNDVKAADKVSAERWFFNANNDQISIMSAKENNAYGTAKAQRTVALIHGHELFEHSVMVDVFTIKDDKKHVYDLPFYYKGQLIHTNVDYKNFSTQRETMGDNNGYQHLWKEAVGKPAGESMQTVWIKDGRFYTLTSEAHSDDEMFFIRIGANVPEFSLRNETGFMFRRSDKAEVCFVNVIEVHGSINVNTELVENHIGIVSGVRTLVNNSDHTVVEISTHKNKSLVLAIANAKNGSSEEHSAIVGSKEYTWEGPFFLFESEL